MSYPWVVSLPAEMSYPRMVSLPREISYPWVVSLPARGDELRMIFTHAHTPKHIELNKMSPLIK